MIIPFDPDFRRTPRPHTRRLLPRHAYQRLEGDTQGRTVAADLLALVEVIRTNAARIPDELAVSEGELSACADVARALLREEDEVDAFLQTIARRVDEGASVCVDGE